MKASILDLRRRMSRVLHALDQNEPVTIVHRGKRRGILYPDRSRQKIAVTEHPAFGMWRDRKDLRDVGRAVRKLREGRADAL